MKRRTHIQLTPYEDLFSTEEQRQDYPYALLASKTGIGKATHLL